MIQCQEECAIVLVLDFLDHGKVHDIAFVRAEEAQWGEERLDIAQRHLRLDDPARCIEEGAVGFFGGNQDDFLRGGDHDGLALRLKGNLL